MAYSNGLRYCGRCARWVKTDELTCPECHQQYRRKPRSNYSHRQGRSVISDIPQRGSGLLEPIQATPTPSSPTPRRID